jgi:GT2 family glycosyltransferase
LDDDSGYPAIEVLSSAASRWWPAPGASIIVPAYNQSQHLAHCLAAILRDAPDGAEVIVVDDASTDDTVATARASAVRIVRSATNRGPAHARNLGARHARGEILIFVDADVEVAPGGLARMIGAMRDAPEIDAVFGSYDTGPHARSLVSEYRNLLHHFMHQTGRAEATTFWAGCGAIRRRAFEQVGGFDERADLHYIEDIELGYRLRRSGARIRLDKRILATHRKRWRLPEMIRTDTLRRARPWARLLLQGEPLSNDLNLKWGQRAAVALTAGGSVLVLLGPFAPATAPLGVLALLGALTLNAPLFRFLWGLRGAGFAVACMPLHLIHHLSSAAGFAITCFELGLLHRRPGS